MSDEGKENLALQVVKEYADAMYRADQWHREERRRIKRERSITAAEEHSIFCSALAEKVAAYRRLWREDGDYWKPGSVDWPSGFDSKQASAWAASEEEGGRVLVSYCARGLGSDEQINRFMVDFFEDGPKIVGFVCEFM